MENRYLAHYGVKGMKWGIWNEETRARRRAKIDKALSPTVKRGKDKPNISPAEKYFKDSENIVTSAGNVSKSLSNINRRKREAVYKNELSKMSNSDIQDVINRMNLERQYINAKEETVRDGYKVADDILSVTKDLLVIGGSVTAILATANALRKG